MTDELVIQPAKGPIVGRIRPPGSKSITNRALVCAALADGVSTLTGALDAEDTRVMIECLGRLGIRVDAAHENRTLTVHGAGGEIPALEAELYCGNSGTTIRFLTAVATLGHGAFRLDGNERMRARPVGDLIAALNQLGANVSSEPGNDCPPVLVHANGLPGGTAAVAGDVSSQFLSGLLLAAPAARSPVELQISGPLVSQPYVRMTIGVMHAFGVDVVAGDAFDRFDVAAPFSYSAKQYAVEPDASAASYFWAAAAITGGKVRVEGLGRASLQGDVAFVNCLEEMGCSVTRKVDSIMVEGGPLRGIEVEMNAISDTAQTLAAVALFADGATTIRGIGHVRRKESDRIGDLSRELRRLGTQVDEHDDGLTIHPRPLRAASVQTYDDHRMAMSLALAGLRVGGIRIQHPECVAKTYPGFFADLADLQHGKLNRE